MVASPTRRIGLIADPGLPVQVAEGLAHGLGEDLGREVDAAVPWQIEVSGKTLPLTEAGEIPLVQHAPGLLKAHDWDAVVYVTDLPRRHRDDPVLVELSTQDRCVLVCLPALGAWRVTARARALLVPLLAALCGCPVDAPAGAERVPGTVYEESTSGTRYLIRPGRINRLRLLTGMVRNNRPGGLLPALSSTAAAAVGTGAFGIFYASIWTMADSLPPARLALISVGVIAALSFWLISYNGLWTTGRGIDGRGSPWLDNAATIITVGLSVTLMYILLYLVLLGAALLIITGDYLASQLSRPVSLLDHLKLTWLAASLGTLGGAIGSNFDSDRAINQATYSRREYERRQRAKHTDT